MPEMSCDHKFVYLRQECVDKNPGQWHSDQVLQDVYFCEKCLAYQQVKVKEIPR